MPAVIAPKQVSGVCRVARVVQAAVVGGGGGGDHDDTLAKGKNGRTNDGKGEKAIRNMHRFVAVQGLADMRPFFTDGSRELPSKSHLLD